MEGEGVARLEPDRFVVILDGPVRIILASVIYGPVLVGGGRLRVEQDELSVICDRPVEVAPFGLGATRQQIERRCAGLGLRGAIELRGKAGAAFVTDGGHYILDCAFGRIGQPEPLAQALDSIPGVMGHGLFLGLASAAILASEDGLKVIGDLA